MRRIDVAWSGGIPGYGDCRPDGRWAVAVPGVHVKTSTGSIAETPGGPAGFLRLPRAGLRIAAVGQTEKRAHAYEWTGAAWENRGPCCGNNAVIYDAADRLVVAHCEPAVGSQGWRSVNAAGALVPAQTTYADKRRGIFEYTEFPDLTIGQADQERGIVVRLPGDTLNRQLLGPEYDAHNVHVSRVGDALAIAATCYRNHTTVLLWCTRAELAALPYQASPPIIVKPPTKPVDPPPKVITMKLPANVKAIRARYVARYPVPQAGGSEASAAFEERARQWSIALAEQVRYETNDPKWGVKRAGNGRPISKDTIANSGPPFVVWDLMVGTGTGHPSLAADPDSQEVAGQIFVPVQPRDHLGAPPQQGGGGDTGNTGDTSEGEGSSTPPQFMADVLAGIARVEAAIATMREGVTSAVADLKTEVAKGIKVRW